MSFTARSAAVLSATLAFVDPSLAAPRLVGDAIEKAAFAPLPEPPPRTANPLLFKTEVLLDRARFSPGAIDGIDGDNFRKAVAAYARVNAIPASSPLDQAVWTKLSGDTNPVLTHYELTAKDLKGPFTKRIPSGFEKQSHLKRLGYRNIKELLAERFHLSVAALVALNPTVRFKKAGESLTVPNLQSSFGTVKATRVVVDKADHEVEAFGPDNKILAIYPASIGSDEKPAPSGNFEIRRVSHNPDYTYNPAYGFKGVKAKKAFTIAPGPNNPVGAVWMDLSFEGYGIHGTPEPESIGKTQSHGCIRMTNWDALDLALLVDKGTPVSFQDQP